MSEENKALTRHSWEVIVNQRDLGAIDMFYAPDAVRHEPHQDLQGREEVKQWLARLFEAFPDLNISVEDAIAEGDKVVTRYTIRATHLGETEKFGPPTGRHIELKGTTIHRIEGGMIVEDSDCYDNMTILQQMGRVPG
jgi:steroid delta-isomerase-like uncharacterized protein